MEKNHQEAWTKVTLIYDIISRMKYHSRTKFIDIQLHFIREKIEDGIIDMKYCATNDMFVDVLTKALVKDRHHELIQKIRMKAF